MKRNLHIAQAVILTCWVVAVLVTAYPGMVNATILTVTTNSDTGDDFTFGVDIDSDTADGSGLSLREAMNWAVAGDTVTFNAGLAGSTVTLNGTQLTFNKNIVMVGDLDSNGTPDITIDGNNASRVITMPGYLNVSARLDGFTITNGTAAMYGGGIYNSYTGATIINCIFSGNSAGHSGGAICNVGIGKNPVITNCTFSGNTAVFMGGAIFNRLNANPVIMNCTFSGNTANVFGGAMYSHESSPAVTNCIFWGDVPDEIDNLVGSPSVTYSDVQGGYGGGG